MRDLSRLITILGALSSSFVASPAMALICFPCIHQRVVPTAADPQVPTNTKIWTEVDCTSGVLSKKGGTAVSFSLVQIGDVQVLQPDTELEIGATYELTNCSSGANGVLTSFTVSTGPDTQAPLTPIFETGETHSTETCGKIDYVSLEVIAGGNMLVLDIARQSTFDAQTMSGAPVDFFFPNEIPIVGSSDCTNNWNFDEKGDADGTRLGAFDLAGNFSGMSESQTVDAGCSYAPASSTDSSGYVLVMLGGFILVALRRKRIPCGPS